MIGKGTRHVSIAGKGNFYRIKTSTKWKFILINGISSIVKERYVFISIRNALSKGVHVKEI